MNNFQPCEKCRLMLDITKDPIYKIQECHFLCKRCNTERLAKLLNNPKPLTKFSEEYEKLRTQVHSDLKSFDTDQPPIGLKPKFIHDEERINEIFAAIQRMVFDKYPIPPEWLEEYNQLVKKV